MKRNTATRCPKCDRPLPLRSHNKDLPAGKAHVYCCWACASMVKVEVKSMEEVGRCTLHDAYYVVKRCPICEALNVSWHAGHDVYDGPRKGVTA